MEKRETLDGDTVNLEKGAAGLGSGGLETGRGGSGGGDSDEEDEVGSGRRGKSSSHSYPALSSEIFPSEESSEALMREL